MRGNQKLTVILVLGAIAIALLLSGTMAAYTQSFFWSTEISTKPFELKVNDSTAASQTFSDISLPANQEIARSLRINTAGLGTKARLTVTLTATGTGTMPAGLIAKLDGHTAQRSGNTLTSTISIDDAQEKMHMMDVSFLWTLQAGENASAYANSSMTYQVSVEAEQQR